MLRPTPELEHFERDDARRRARRDDYARALDTFTALWVEACSLRDDFPGDWREDLEPDLRIALALNADIASP